MKLMDIAGLSSMVLSVGLALFFVLPIGANDLYTDDQPLPAANSRTTTPQVVETVPVVKNEPQTVVKGETAPIKKEVAEALVASVSPLNASPVARDLNNIGFSLDSLRSQGIEVVSHNGKITKNCVSGPSQSGSIEGIAVRKGAAYTPCPNGEQPLPDSYSAGNYRCFVHYNSSSSKAKAILAHEVAHCLYFIHGEYGQFDIDYRNLRPELTSASTSNYREVMADDFMICYTGLDTNWSNSYHSRNGLAKPSADFCTKFNEITRNQLIR